MCKRFLKTLLVFAVVTVLALGSGDDAEGGARNQTPAPHLVRQVQHGTERYLYVHNTLARPIWGYFECTNHITTVPIGIPGARVAEVRLAGIKADEECLLNHWSPQVEGQSPPEWRP